jgi:TRAP transporter TAXI family solute receptor
MRKKGLSKILVGICLMLAFSLALPLTIAYGQWKPTGTVVVGASQSTSTSYASGLAMLKVITDKTGVQFRMIGDGKTSGRAVMLKDKVVSVLFMPARQGVIALAGTFEYEKWGPQSIRMVWNGGELAQGWAVRGNSGIKAFSDVKGKKVPNFVGDPSANLFYVDSQLAFANLTRKDVVSIPISSYGAGVKGVIAGTVDVSVFSATAAESYELHSSAYGIHWLAMPTSETAGWARFRKLNPAFFPYKQTVGAGISAQNPAQIWAYNMPLVGYDWTDENMAYWFAKQIAENYNAYKDSHSFLKSWTLDHCLDVDTWFIPWHEGSVKYLKEIKRWTPEMERIQQELLAKYPQRMTK